jgi:GNAT superfamily N-acetyltransferase
VTLARVLADATRGAPPPVDGLTELVPAPSGARAAIVGFTGHHVVAADVDPVWVATVCPRWALEAPFGSAFVGGLAERLRARAGTLDVVLVADGTPRMAIDLLRATRQEVRDTLEGAANPRRDVAVWRTPDGAARLVLGHGLEERWEVALEVTPAARGRGLGRRLAAAARGLVGSGELVFAQIAPGNVASLRAALGAGYRPFSAEILFFD